MHKTTGEAISNVNTVKLDKKKEEERVRIALLKELARDTTWSGLPHGPAHLSR